MSSSNYFRSWIDRSHLDPNTRLLTEEYQQGITEFMGLVHRQPEAKTVIKQWDVWTHLYLSGFTRSYKIWYHHGETDYEHGSTSEPQPALKDKDDRISVFETQMAAQQAGYETQKRLNEQMMEMMKRMYPNEVFPNIQDP
ncbi:hypothetical protein IGI04_034515 [Brassica rapa subsp. trilocularis]|uniref:Transposase-associated domain-containing protein n=1 Tax=Brassica rapa subsp. trilocularis TaxID=1813537 RepID=A0ABQ7LAY8_BRACM|nr:hypothetical protein IGI04_034515 [Brassica rapa subsp. trilocularis]